MSEDTTTTIRAQLGRLVEARREETRQRIIIVTMRCVANKADAKTRQGSFFFGGPTEYADILEKWRAAGDLAGLDVRGGQSGP